VRDYSFKVPGGWPTLLLHPHDATDFVVRLMPGKINPELRQLFGDEIRGKLFVGEGGSAAAGEEEDSAAAGEEEDSAAAGEEEDSAAAGEEEDSAAAGEEEAAGEKAAGEEEKEGEDEIRDDNTTDGEEEAPRGGGTTAVGISGRVQLKHVGPSLIYSAREYVAGAGADLQEKFGPALDQAVREEQHQQTLSRSFRWNAGGAAMMRPRIFNSEPSSALASKEDVGSPLTPESEDGVDRAGVTKVYANNDDNGASGGLPAGWKRAVDSQAPKVNDNGASGGLPVGSSRLEAFMSVPAGWKRPSEAEEERPLKKLLLSQEERQEREKRSAFTCEILERIDGLSKPERKLSKEDIQLLSSKYVALTKERLEMKDFHDMVGVIDHVSHSLSRLSVMHGRLSEENYKCMHEGLMECLRF
jgi:hypothetical protein